MKTNFNTSDIYLGMPKFFHLTKHIISQLIIQSPKYKNELVLN